MYSPNNQIITNMDTGVDLSIKIKGGGVEPITPSWILYWDTYHLWRVLFTYYVKRNYTIFTLKVTFKQAYRGFNR